MILIPTVCRYAVALLLLSIVILLMLMVVGLQ